MAKLLNHITDLHKLDDAEVAQFAAELPSIVASLRIAARTASRAGIPLSEAFPTLTFVPEMNDTTIFRRGNRQVEVNHGDAAALDRAQAAADQVLRNMTSTKGPRP